MLIVKKSNYVFIVGTIEQVYQAEKVEFAHSEESKETTMSLVPSMSTFTAFTAANVRVRAKCVWTFDHYFEGDAPYFIDFHYVE
jgi:hypothetical protein